MTWSVQKQPSQPVKKFEDEIEKKMDEIDQTKNIPTLLLASHNFQLNCAGVSLISPSQLDLSKKNLDDS